MTVPSRALLIGWQAADWKLLNPLLDQGQMPHLQALLDRGVMGSLMTPAPLSSAPLAASLATGRRAFGHRILGERHPRNPSARNSLQNRQCPAFWDVLAQSGRTTHLVAWPFTHPAEETGGVCLSDVFFLNTGPDLIPQSILPEGLAAPLAEWRINPREVDAATIRFFVPDFAQVPQDRDSRLIRIAHAVARTFSTQAAATWLMENRPWEVTAVQFDLLGDLASWAMALTPPKLEIVNEREFQLYQQVMSAGCRALDLMLGTLVKLAGTEATVMLVSDHGLLTGPDRPPGAPARPGDLAPWRKREGILALAGPGVKKDEIVFGANLLDVVPTLLARMNVALPAVLEGRVLAEAFEEPLALQKENPVSAPSAPSGKSDPAGEGTRDGFWLERQWNLAHSLADGRRLIEALAVVDELSLAQPGRLDFLHFRFEGYLALGKMEECRDCMERLLDHVWETPLAGLMQARFEYALHHFDKSLAHLEALDLAGDVPPGVHLQVGLNLIKLNQRDKARAAFKRELALHPESAEAHAGLAYVHLRAEEYEKAVERALQAISLNYNLLHAHFVLGLAQARLGRVEEAIVALRLTLALAPDCKPAHRCLAVLYAHDPARQDLARQHREMADRCPAWAWGF